MGVENSNWFATCRRIRELEDQLHEAEKKVMVLGIRCHNRLWPILILSCALSFTAGVGMASLFIYFFGSL